MGKKKKRKLYPQRFSKKFASHPYIKAQVQEAPLVEEVVEVVETPVEPVVVEPAPKAEKPKRTRKKATAPKRKTTKRKIQKKDE
jgi:hypothetical protein